MIKPVGTRILVKPDVVEEKTKGNILLPPEVRDRMALEAVRGEVIEVGEFAWVELTKKLVEKGDHVIFAKWGGLIVKDDDGKELRLLNDEDILAVIRDTAPNLSDK